MTDDEKKRAYNREAQRKYRAANREKVREKGRLAARARRAADREKDRAYQRDYVAKNRDRISTRAQAYKRQRAYGITAPQWDEMFARQGRCCAICSTTSPGKNGWSTDHCHNTGLIRGILCSNCNRGIGFLADDPIILEQAIEYLTRETHTKPKAD